MRQRVPVSSKGSTCCRSGRGIEVGQRVRQRLLRLQHLRGRRRTRSRGGTSSASSTSATPCSRTREIHSPLRPTLDEAQAIQVASGIWHGINGKNFKENIDRASVTPPAAPRARHHRVEHRSRSGGFDPTSALASGWVMCSASTSVPSRTRRLCSATVTPTSSPLASDHATTMPSMVFADDDAGELLVGDAARRRGQEDPIRLARRVGTSATPPRWCSAARASPPRSWQGDAPPRRRLRRPARGRPPQSGRRRRPANWGEYPARAAAQEPIYHPPDGERSPTRRRCTSPAAGGRCHGRIPRRRHVRRGPCLAGRPRADGEPKGIERLSSVDFEAALVSNPAQCRGTDRRRHQPSAATTARTPRRR